MALDVDQNHVIGRWMIYAAWILLLALLTWFFNGFLEKQLNPNRVLVASRSPNGKDQISLARNRYGHYVTSGSINGQEVTFLLDTGATHISVPKKIAARLNLRPGVAQSVMTANGTITVYNTELTSVAIGPLEVRNLRAGINPHMAGNEVLLGMNFLKHFEIVQQADRWIIRKPASSM